MTRRQIWDQVQEIEWYHSITLPDGIVTPGVNNTPVALARLDLPASFSGKSVLDIGAWDGFYSFEAARRGASRVVASDSFVWEGRWGQRGFNLARSQLGLESIVEDRKVDVMDLPGVLGDETFDVVFFLGVLYHLRDPIGALERVATVTKDLLVLETETAVNYLPFPAARLWPNDELAGDDTNWWSVNARALIATLRSLGFIDVRTVYRTSSLRRAARAIRTRNGVSGLRSARIVIHARRKLA
jgi:tRNA (mo5U34)-methyltransferase